jgi:hypothetical protein
MFCRGGAGRPDSGAAERGGQFSGFGRVAPTISPALPPVSARPAKALAIFPRPMMLMLLMDYPVLTDDRKG